MTAENDIPAPDATGGSETPDAVHSRLQEQDEKLGHVTAAVNELVGRSRHAEARGWAYACDQARAKMQQAVEFADPQGFARAQAEYEQLTSQRPQTAAAPTGADHPAVAAWERDNAWFHQDRKLAREAVAIEANLMEENPYMTTAQRLDTVRKEVARRHPDKFGHAPGGQATRTPGGQRQRTGRTVADLPPDARDALAKIKNQDHKFTDEMYLKNFKWDD
jgi:hypothetical protein